MYRYLSRQKTLISQNEKRNLYLYLGILVDFLSQKKVKKDDFLSGVKSLIWGPQKKVLLGYIMMELD